MVLEGGPHPSRLHSPANRESTPSGTEAEDFALPFGCSFLCLERFTVNPKLFGGCFPQQRATEYAIFPSKLNHRPWTNVTKGIDSAP